MISMGFASKINRAHQSGVPVFEAVFWQCLPKHLCLNSKPDTLGQPFEGLIVEQEAKLATQRQRLNDEGMLLTPAEVLQLDSFSFDPFAD